MECAVDLGAFGLDPQAVVLDVDDQRAEHPTEKIAADWLSRARIECCRILEQIDVREGDFGSVLQSELGLGELLGDCALLQRDIGQSLLELGAVDRSFGHDIDQALLLGLETLEFRVQGCLDLVLGRLEFIEGLVDLATDVLDGLGAELFVGNRFCDGLLDVVHADVVERAVVALLS